VITLDYTVRFTSPRELIFQNAISGSYLYRTFSLRAARLFFSSFLGILVWTIISLLNPHSFAWQVTSNFRGLRRWHPNDSGAFSFFRREVVKRILTMEVGLMLVLWAWFTFTTIHNTSQSEFITFRSDTWYRWRFVSKIMLMSVMMIAIVILGALPKISPGRVRLPCYPGHKAIPFMIFTAGSFRVYGPPGSMLADNNDMGLALNMTLPMFFFLARVDPDRRIRRFMSFVFLATIPAILFTYSRGAVHWNWRW